jgi:predicted HicB family RNase H-like nuclease
MAPAPVDVVVLEPDAYEKYSGQFTVRVPKSLHRDLWAVAQVENMSLNQTVAEQLRHAVQCERNVIVPAGRFISVRNRPHSRNASGVWVQRVSRPLHQQLDLWANDEGMSLNSLILFALARYCVKQSKS